MKAGRNGLAAWSGYKGDGWSGRGSEEFLASGGGEMPLRQKGCDGARSQKSFLRLTVATKSLR